MDGASGAAWGAGLSDGGNSSTVSEATQEEGSPSLRRRLRRSVAVETLIAVAVLALTVSLTSTEPGRTAKQNAAASVSGAPAPPPAGSFGLVSFTVPFDTGAPNGTGRGKVEINVSPGRTGRNEPQAVVFGPDDGIVTVPEMRITFTSTAKNIGPLDTKIKNAGGY
ncbi:hypothetical protein [Streptomyces sp. 8N616]|uniref:hypothetical protein n=1 Tax=Streptomyces sp. 8N616 TaxID=3457414 RepID=UPI003FD1A735